MSCQGSVKSFNDAKGWGFITHEDKDIFLHVKDCVGGRPQKGDWVSFDIEEDKIRDGQMKALNVTGGTGVSEEKGKGKGKGGYGPAWGALGWGGAPAVGGSGKFQGEVKSFNDAKGWGFINHEGKDIFLHSKDCVGSRPQPGDWVTFDMEEDPVRGGQMKATNITGGSAFFDGGGKGKGMKGGCAGAMGWGGGSGKFQGEVKSFNDAKGWGFINHEGKDIFLHVKDCVANRPQPGDWVSFDMEEDPVRGGQMKATNITGGSAFFDGGGKGKGMKGGFGGWGGARAGPYGGGYGMWGAAAWCGGGWGKGKGKGGW